MKLSRLRTIIAVCAIALMTGGCAQLRPSSTSILIAPATEKTAQCAGLNGLTDALVSARMDVTEVVIGKLRRATGKTNEQICAMTEPEMSRIMLADRNQYRNPDRKSFLAPAKEFMRQWDADDQGRLPTSTQVLAADTARKSLAGRIRLGDGVGEANIAQGAGTGSSQWTPIGPGNIGGRVRAIAIDPRNANRLFIGAASGGIWLTEDAGQSYRPLQDFMGNLAIGALVIDPVNPNVMYAGTGESFAGLPGIGVFKSVDGGVTWAILQATNTDISVGRHRH